MTIEEDDGWHWYFGIGDEPEMYCPADSREDAIEQATEEARDKGYDRMTICQGKAWPLLDDFFDADWVIEHFEDKNDDRCDEEGDLGMSASAAQKRELENALNETFLAWRKKHDLGRAWNLDTRHDEVIWIETSDGAGDAGTVD